MKKKFKFKNRVSNYIKYPLLLFLLFIVLGIIINLVSKIRLNITDNTLVYYILDDTNPFIKNNQDKYKIDLFFKNIYKIDFENPVTLLQKTSPYIEIKDRTVFVYNNNYTLPAQSVINQSDLPLVYIYNTHPTETFKNSELSAYNIEPNIREMSDILKDKLNEIGVNVIVEDADITDFLKQHNYNYNQSYLASLYYLKQAYQKNPSIDLFIDLHRDGIAYEYSVATIDNVKYAKIMFVVGLNHDNYKNSINISNGINKYLVTNYPSISRGIYTNAYADFNQNFTNNMILIELGGNNNELTEVLNSVNVLAVAIKEYLYENR